MMGVKVAIRDASGGRVDTVDFDALLDIELGPGKLRRALVAHPQRYGKYARLHGLAIVLRERAKEALDDSKVELDSKIRGKAIEAEQKLTEAQVKALVEQSDRFKRARESLLMAREQEETLKALREALQARLQVMLVIARGEREEADTDPGARVDTGRVR